MNTITEMLAGIPLNAVLREKISAFEKRQVELLSENAILTDKLALSEAENTHLKEKVKRLQSAAANASEYTEAGGAFFKRLASGGYCNIPYCPKCHSAMFHLGGPIPFTCGNQACKQAAGFSRRDLAKVMSNLPP